MHASSAASRRPTVVGGGRGDPAGSPGASGPAGGPKGGLQCTRVACPRHESCFRGIHYRSYFPTLSSCGLIKVDRLYVQVCFA